MSWFAWGRQNWAGLDAEVIDKVVADGGEYTMPPKLPYCYPKTSTDFLLDRDTKE